MNALFQALGLLAPAIVSICLTGCGKASDGSTPATAAQPNEPTQGLVYVTESVEQCGLNFDIYSDGSVKNLSTNEVVPDGDYSVPIASTGYDTPIACDYRVEKSNVILLGFPLGG